MATFEVKIHKIVVESHPNADAIELAIIGGYQSIIRKGTFKTGELAAYIPEGAIVPETILTMLGLDGKLAGKAKNRVKAIKLRGILSQGIIVPVHYYESHTGIPHRLEIGEQQLLVSEGDDVTDWLGITKWQPPIPVNMAGEVFNAFDKTIKYDIENIKNYPEILDENDQIYIQEKIHGTWMCMGSHPEVPHPIVTSKGLSGQGLAFKFNDTNTNNLYIKTYNATLDDNAIDSIMRAADSLGVNLSETPLYLLGEVFGTKVQDLTYGVNTPQFRLFDIYVGVPGSGKYLDPKELKRVAMDANIPVVPTLYIGRYSKEIVEACTNGKETLSGKNTHIREGIVIKPEIGKNLPGIGRVILKSVSADYLLRKGNPTEHN